MESAFGWIGKIIEFLFSLLPLLTIVKPTHAGIAFVRGNEIKRMYHSNGIWILNIKWFALPKPKLWGSRSYWLKRTGLHLTWPFWTEVMTYPIVRQTINLPAQTLITKDQKTVIMSSIIVYEIDDIEKVLVEMYEPETVIRDVAMAAIKRVVLGQKLGALLQHSKEIDQQLTLTVRSVLAKQFGIKVIKVMFTDLAPTRSFRLWNNPFEYTATEEE